MLALRIKNWVVDTYTWYVLVATLLVFITLKLTDKNMAARFADATSEKPMSKTYEWIVAILVGFWMVILLGLTVSIIYLAVMAWTYI